MRPAKEFSAAREHFGEISTLEYSFPSLIFAMRYQNLSPRLNLARITQESYIRIMQAFHVFQDSAVFPLLCHNNIITRRALQLLSIVQHSGNYLSESLACVTVVGIM